MGSDRSLYNYSLLVARGIRELELGVQKNQKENGNTTAHTEYNRESKNENWVWLSVRDSHGKLVVGEELKVSL
jgi:hypothetical protein